MVITDFISGHILGAIVWGISLIFVSVFAFFKDRPFVEEKVRPWLRPIPFIALSVLLIWKLFSPSGVKRKVEESPKPLGFHQNPVISPESALNGDLQGTPKPVLSDLHQKARNILTSEEVKQEIKAAVDAGTQPEFLKSFSNFKDYMISKGMTEFGIIDQAPSHFQELFQKHYPGKAPSDLDLEMRQRLIDMIQEFGYEEGRKKFLRTPKIAIWTVARFNILDNPESISAWTTSVYTDKFGDIVEAPVSTAPPAVSQEALPFDENTSNIPFAATETVPFDRPQTTTESAPEIVDTDSRGVTSPAVEPEMVITEKPEAPSLPSEEELETVLRERFSSERFERAMSTLEQYGPEEGLRRLREDDPEIAKQIDNSRNRVEDSRRAGVEHRRDREDKEEDSR